MKKLLPLLLALMALGLTGCQDTQLLDIIDYHPVKGKKLESMQREVTLRFKREAVLYDQATTPHNDMKADAELARALDDRDALNALKALPRVTVPKGAKVKVLGYANPVGQRKDQPDLYLNDDPWLVLLPDGRRAYMPVPEMAIGVKSKKGNEVEDVRLNQDKSCEAPYQFRCKGSDKWLFRPNLHYKRWQDVPIYSYPRRHEQYCLPYLHLWNSIAKNNINRVCFKDDAYYLYRPLVRLNTFWSMALNMCVLTPLLLIIIFCLLVPWVALRMVWRIRPLPNWLVKVLAGALCFLMFAALSAFFACAWYGVLIYLGIAIMNYTKYLSMDVDWERCPHCHRLGIRYEGTQYGKWRSKTSAQQQKEVKYQTSRDYETIEGGQRVKVHETTNHMGIKEYLTHSRRRSYTDSLTCPYCGEKISLHDTEEHITTSSQWKS